MLSDKEKKSKQYEKELKSLRNKMGSNLVWFDSLGRKRQYDVLFLWKKRKATNKLTKPEYKWISVPSWINKQRILKVATYPPSLKHFIREIKKQYKFKTNTKFARNAAIDILLNSKK